MKIGYFDSRYCKNLWTRKNLPIIASNADYNYKFKEIIFEKYWVAPTQYIYKLGVEKIIPQSLIQLIGMHQSILLQKVNN